MLAWPSLPRLRVLTRTLSPLTRTLSPYEAWSIPASQCLPEPPPDRCPLWRTALISRPLGLRGGAGCQSCSLKGCWKTWPLPLSSHNRRIGLAHSRASSRSPCTQRRSHGLRLGRRHFHMSHWPKHKYSRARHRDHPRRRKQHGQRRSKWFGPLHLHRPLMLHPQDTASYRCHPRPCRRSLRYQARAPIFSVCSQSHPPSRTTLPRRGASTGMVVPFRQMVPSPHPSRFMGHPPCKLRPAPRMRTQRYNHNTGLRQLQAGRSRQ